MTWNWNHFLIAYLVVYGGGRVLVSLVRWRWPRKIRVVYAPEPGRITYCSPITYRSLREARRKARRLNERSLWGKKLPGNWAARV